MKITKSTALSTLARYIYRDGATPAVAVERLHDLMTANGMSEEQFQAVLNAAGKTMTPDDGRKMERAAREGFNATMRDHIFAAGGNPRLSRQDRMIFSEAIRKRSYAGLPTLDDDLRATINLISSFDGGEIGQRIEARQALSIPEVRLDWLTCGKWAACGFPTIVMGHKYAAALMATTLNEEAVEALRLPFPAFVIDVPAGLLQCDGVKEQPGVYDVTYISVASFTNVGAGESGISFYSAQSNGGPELHRFGGPGWKDMLMPEDRSEAEKDPLAFGLDPLTERDDRCHVLIQRLIGGVCLAMSDPSNVQRNPVTSARAQRRRAERGHQPPLPEAAIYRLGKPIELDCRREVREYLDGKRHAAPSVRVLVRGHWRRQHHGARREMVKVIWIQPFWRGADDAPIAVRPHVMPET